MDAASWGTLGRERWQGVAPLKKVSPLGFAGKSGPRARGAPRRGANARVLRIIGGTWRGRKLRFPAAADIRPTPDRVRETLFNWLGARTSGARCLDLFAGSGALGLEALSRGAAHVDLRRARRGGGARAAHAARRVAGRRMHVSSARMLCVTSRSAAATLRHRVPRSALRLRAAGAGGASCSSSAAGCARAR